MVQHSTPVSLTVIPKSLATVTGETPQPNVKIGKETQVRVRLNRQYGYTGPFKVKLIIPGERQGAGRRRGDDPGRAERGDAGGEGRRQRRPRRPRQSDRPGQRHLGKKTILHKAQPVNLNVTK